MTEHGEHGGHSAFSRIPTWDGNPTSWWRYKQDEVKYSLAARMVQRLTGTARIRANLLAVDRLRPQRQIAAAAAVVNADGETESPAVIAVEADWRRGIDYLLSDLEKMPGIPKVVRTGNQRSWFYKSLSRRPGETMANWLTRFRAGLKRCADEGVNMHDQDDLGWWLVEKSLLTKERKERLQSRLTQDFDFAEVAAEMLAIFGEIHLGEGRPGNPPRGATGKGGGRAQANVTEQDNSELGSERSPEERSDDESSATDPDGH